MQVRRMMSENKDLRNRNKVEGKPSGNSSRNDAHKVKYYDKIIVIYNIVRTLPNFWLIFFNRIVKKMGQKLILGHNFINIIRDDFYVLQLFIYNIF